MAAVLEPIYYELEELPSVIKLSTSTIQRQVREGSFPAPRELSGRRVGWLVREVREWAENRPVSDLPPPPNTGKRRAPTDASPERQEPPTSRRDA